MSSQTRREKKKAARKAATLDPQARPGPRAPAADRIPTGRRPAILQAPQLDDNRLVVRFNEADVEGPWCLSKITPDDHRTLLRRLRDIETQTAHEVFNSGSNTGAHYDVEEIPNPDVPRRLEEIGRPDETRISRLRITKQYRLHGLLKRNHFFALWWDPGHEVYPTTR